MKYLVSQNTQHYFQSIDYQVTQVLGGAAVPSLVRTLYSKVQGLCRYLVKM